MPGLFFLYPKIYKVRIVIEKEIILWIRQVVIYSKKI